MITRNYRLISIFFINVCLIKNIFYTFFRIHFWSFFGYMIFSSLKNAWKRGKTSQNEKTFRTAVFHIFLDFLSKFFFSWTFTLNPSVPPLWYLRGCRGALNCAPPIDASLSDSFTTQRFIYFLYLFISFFSSFYFFCVVVFSPVCVVFNYWSLLLLFDDNKLKMARKPGKILKEKPVECTGEDKRWK